MDARGTVTEIQRTALFERCLDDLLKKGGAAGTAAKKAEEFILAVTGEDGQSLREKFSFTRHGEARIKNCRKVDLGGGYRIICLFKDGRLVLLYAGSHDDCSRWLMRNRRMNYKFDNAGKLSTARKFEPQKEPVPENPAEDCQLADWYESELMSKIDDAMLRKVFSGIVNRRG